MEEKTLFPFVHYVRNTDVPYIV